MTVQLIRKPAEPAAIEASAPETQVKKTRIRAKAPVISLDQPGRLRVTNLMAILGVSHSTLYSGLKTARYPKADGFDGTLPYWKTSTIKAFLET